ncbi:hypothetical protein AAVH_20871 [Aphelenchoides avenae]|nr:hypothetical protein AAVH_20871 [Aphelenchus avenae]
MATVYGADVEDSRNIPIVVIRGPPDSFKKEALMQKWPGAYVHNPRWNFWDGYLNDEVVIISEFDGDVTCKHAMSIADILQVAKGTAPMGTVNRGYIPMHAKMIIVTTTIEWGQWFVAGQENIKEAIRRQIKEMWRFWPRDPATSCASREPTRLFPENPNVKSLGLSFNIYNEK